MLSICIFGSEARGTTDAFSDRDVLFVGPSSAKMDRAISHWSERAWNVSVFHHAAFQRLAELKVLFVQHLKQEGVLLHDDEAFLTLALRKFAPKSDYSAERNDAFKQIMSLPSCEGIYWYDMCLADVLFVLFRNASILHIACTGQYKFDYDSIVECMSDLFGLSQTERWALLALRGLKHGYRRRLEGLTVKGSVKEARQVIDRLIERLPDTHASSIATGATTDKYYKLRLKELELVAHHHPSQLDDLGPSSNIFGLWQRIRSSGGYPKPRVTFQ